MRRWGSGGVAQLRPHTLPVSWGVWRSRAVRPSVPMLVRFLDVPRQKRDDEPVAATAAADSTVALAPPVGMTTATVDSKHSLLKDYLTLSKYRLSSQVVLTAAGGYAMAPEFLCDFRHAFQLAALCVGTGLCAASAHAFNQIIEINHDAAMTRTKTRPLPAGRVSVHHAIGFGTAVGATGVGLLAFTVNPITAALGLGNIGLYTMMYTPLKRASPLNTWVGALVGAIPPIMGYTGCTGMIDVQALIMGYVLFCWQMPHFMSLSFNYRRDYTKAGFKMLSTSDPKAAAAVSLRHSLYMVPLPAITLLAGMTTPAFLIDGTLLNAYLVHVAYKFHKEQNDKNARKVFLHSLASLPLFFILMLIHKDKAREKPAEEIPLVPLTN